MCGAETSAVDKYQVNLLNSIVLMATSTGRGSATSSSTWIEKVHSFCNLYHFNLFFEWSQRHAICFPPNCPQHQEIKRAMKRDTNIVTYTYCWYLLTASAGAIFSVNRKLTWFGFSASVQLRQNSNPHQRPDILFSRENF